MWFFKKKKVIESKYQIRQMVNFRYKGELTYGFIYEIKEDKDGNVLYDIQVMGQCPWFAYDIEESVVTPFVDPMGNKNA